MLAKIKIPFRRFPILTRVISIILLPAICALIYFIYQLRIDLPPDVQIIRSAFLTSEAKIKRDLQGVPHIEAGSRNDAFFAVGYVHAQDRMWQLVLQRRIVQGRMSELFGKEMLRQDIWFRTLGLYQAAEKSWSALSPEAQSSLTAYSNGINTAMAAQHGLPLEFRILGLRPEKWTEIDSLAWIKMFALSLGTNFRNEMSRYMVNNSFSEEQLNTIFPNILAKPAQANKNVQFSRLENSKIDDLLAFQSELETRLGLGGKSVGSNAWVVSAKYTAGGSTLLANDPHLGLQIPSLWYAIRVKGGDLNVSGMSLVGLPVVIFGRNDHIAWGGTSMIADTQDLFFERPAAANTNEYIVDGKINSYITHRETINIRADFPEVLHEKFIPVTVQIRASRHGPIISDQFQVSDCPVSLRWPALDAGDTSYDAFYKLNFARDWGQFKAALGLLIAPVLNMVYADKKGNIGLLGAGKIPIRGSGNGSQPGLGWDSSFDWRGYIPQAAMPSNYNPKGGIIVAANDNVIDPNYKYFISRDWASPARGRRIRDLLVLKLRAARLTVKDMKDIQIDTVDTDAKAVIDSLNGFMPTNEKQRAVWSRISGWNGDMSATSSSAAVFQFWMNNFKKRLLDSKTRSSDETRIKHIEGLISGIGNREILNILSNRNAAWCANSALNSKIICQDELSASLDDSINQIAKLSGSSNVRNWRWGHLQSTVYTHVPFSQSKFLKFFFERSVGNGGSENSINVSASVYRENEGFIQSFGPSFRQIMSLGQADFQEYMNSTGQSGNPISNHYSDMVVPFRDGQYHLLTDTVTMKK